MSMEAVGWAVTQTAGSPEAKLLLMMISDCQNSDGICHFVLERMALETEIPLDQLPAAIDRLIARGLLAPAPVDPDEAEGVPFTVQAVRLVTGGRP